MDPAVVYYAQLGFGALLMSGVVFLSIYVVRRKLQLEKAQRSRDSVAPAWLRSAAAAHKATLTGTGIAIRGAGFELQADIVGTTRLFIRVRLDVPTAGSLQAGAPSDAMGPLAEAATEAGWQIRGLPAMAGVLLSSEVKANLREGARLAAGPGGILIRTKTASADAAGALLRLAVQLAEKLPRGGAGPAPDLCLLCGAMTAKGCVACGGCKALFHHACWEFAGRCVTCGASSAS